MNSCFSCKNRSKEMCTDCVGWNLYESSDINNHRDTDISKEMTMLAKYALNDIFGLKNAHKNYSMSIKNVIFNYPATIVLWADGTKTVVKAGEDDIYDPEKGLAMAIAKKALGNRGNYYEVFKKWLPEEEEDETGMTDSSMTAREIVEDLDKTIKTSLGITINPDVKHCGNCDKTNGLCYESDPPKVKCTITGEFHEYGDICNVKEDRNENNR